MDGQSPAPAPSIRNYKLLISNSPAPGADHLRPGIDSRGRAGRDPPGLGAEARAARLVIGSSLRAKPLLDSLAAAGFRCEKLRDRARASLRRRPSRPRPGSGLGSALVVGLGGGSPSISPRPSRRSSPIPATPSNTPR